MDEQQNDLPQDEQMFYGTDQGFYSSLYLQTAYDNGLTDADLTPISWDDYNAWFSIIPGKYSTWVDGKPVILDLPTPDYVAINTTEATRRKSVILATVAIIPAKVAVGRQLTQAEQDRMNAVLDYCDALDALDLSGETVNWPEVP